MNSAIVSVLGIYLFIGVGYLAKRSFKEQIDERTITLLSVYFLQIFLTLWGLLKRPIDTTLLQTPLLYIGITLSLVAVTMFASRLLFADVKERSIATVAALIGNTGNLGIPLGIALFGEESVPYTTIINLANVFFVYTFGVYYYSRGNFSVRDSLLNIVKLPVLWAALVAIALNLGGYRPSGTVEETLTMGAYASMVMQLVLFGIYLYDTKITELNRVLIGWVNGLKFLAVPAVTYAILSLTDLPEMVKGILFMEMLMPLAVANVNLASLYDCRPKALTALVFITSVLFLGIIFAAMRYVPWLTI
ncbi:AEC family transporter [Sulfurimonas sp. HSL-3221]|uniref:AEC family transporter n=1 Tax=Sulfurimonadaceae TaxID=2771471 RepID=UPI001E2F7AE8|nr:AEC family transporter [Sulfurimonas sp. HSL-3221]UFS62646.1 AEC family transporter [Sulfurimonas sp. HSL-3221]